MLKAKQVVQQARFTHAGLARKDADAVGQCLFKRFQAIFGVAGDHQDAIANFAIDIHLLIDEGHPVVVQQIDFV